MSEEKKICQNCKQQFTIVDEDFAFYEKIKVPPPTFCPECRTIRRLSWRNEMTLHKRPCTAPGHSEIIVSIYHPDEKLNVYDLKEWWSDTWDAVDYGAPYDFAKPFFAQWSELYHRVPLQALSNSKSVNSDYCNVAEESRDSYMSSASWRIERTHYANRVSESKDSADLYMVLRSELCYDDVICSDCYRVLYSLKCKSCVDSYFLYDCHGCTNCFGCTNLRNKSYCMWNEQLSREVYDERLKELHLESYTSLQNLKEKFKVFRENAIHRFANQNKVMDVTGDNLEGTKNSHFIFDTAGDVEDSKYCHWALRMKQVYDSGPGVGEGELLYEVFDTGIGNFRNLFTSVVYSSNDIEYAFNCYGCSNLFGCIGLRNKSYCILNHQYTKEEYEKMIPRVKEHMMTEPYIDRLGRSYGYGEFFPAELSPFAYNETVAQYYFTKTIDEVQRLGYRWREPSERHYEVTKRTHELPDALAEVTDAILQDVIECEHRGACNERCASAFKITSMELELYRRLNIPLPRVCFPCRHAGRLALRNPMKLWHRSCMNKGCTNEFETSYSPERPEKVYCEKCYQQEVS